ncbi:NUDIX domain-containing protein [Streptomyces coelicoflavus]|uniref:NUDIX domain-containing protein n=1 Tax=Streptomyces coelicoflavus TaxID=285562 RepID=UPI0036A78629
MPIQTDHIRTVITAYLAQHPEDAHEVAVVQGLLDTGCDLTSRKSLPGHVTAGAILVGHDGRVLHILHNATGKWLLPGGHIEPTDDTLLEAAGRELTEETGISPQVVAPHSEVPDWGRVDVPTLQYSGRSDVIDSVVLSSFRGQVREVAVGKQPLDDLHLGDWLSAPVGVKCRLSTVNEFLQCSRQVIDFLLNDRYILLDPWVLSRKAGGRLSRIEQEVRIPGNQGTHGVHHVSRVSDTLWTSQIDGHSFGINFCSDAFESIYGVFGHVARARRTVPDEERHLFHFRSGSDELSIDIMPWLTTLA